MPENQTPDQGHDKLFYRLLIVLVGIVPAMLGGGTGPYRVYLPFYALPTPNKLGVGGATVAQVAAIGGAWTYDWGTHPPYSADVEAVPMIWGPSEAGQPIGGNSEYLLWFNECDLPGQCNTLPELAAQTFVRHYKTTYAGKKHVAPAPSDTGMWWFIRFHDEVRRLTGEFPFQALAFHCYRWSAKPCIQVGQGYLDWAKRLGVPEVWATEFSFVPQWAANPEREARAFVAWLESDPRITRYAVFIAHKPPNVWWWPDERPAADPSLFTAADSTTLTQVGRWYAR